VPDLRGILERSGAEEARDGVYGAPKLRSSAVTRTVTRAGTPPSTHLQERVMMTISDSFVVAGVDVSKASLDVAVIGGSISRSRFVNTPEGQAELARELSFAGCDLTVMESTGGWEAAAACRLQLQELPAAVINPTRVRSFAKSMGYLAKTDKVDAKVLAEFAAVLIRKPDVQRFLLPVKDSGRKELEALMTRRSQLIAMRSAERNRLELAPMHVKPSILSLLKAIEKLLDENDKDLQGRINEHFQELDQLLQSIPGIGPSVSRILIGALPELGHLNRRAISALVGLAPMAKDSGNSQGKRRIQGGRAPIRKTLYMATVAAATYNPVIKAFYQKLKATGKPSKVVLVACMRKLVVILNAMVRTNTPWQLVPITLT
jgi:transposase